MTLIHTRDLQLKTETGRKLGTPIQVAIDQGTTTLIEGPNGSGKSTLLKSLAGLHSHFVGQIERSLSADQIVYLPQLGNVQFFLPLSLGEVVQLDQARSQQDIVKVGLLKAEELSHQWNSASGGERQKALLTRALLRNARLFILDEPMNHLDAQARTLLAKHIGQRRKDGAAFIIASHDFAWPSDLPVMRLTIQGVTND